MGFFDMREIIDRKSEHVSGFCNLGKRHFVATTKAMIYDGRPQNIPYCEKGDCLLTMFWKESDGTTQTELINATKIIRDSTKKLAEIFEVDESLVQFRDSSDCFVVTKPEGYLTQDMKNNVAKTGNLKIEQIDTREFDGHRIIKVLEKSIQTYMGFAF